MDPLSHSMGPSIARAGLPRTALAGQVAIVTGAGRGIGRETARALAWLGAQVAIVELDEDSGLETAQIIRQEGGQALFTRVDVSREDDVAAMIEKTHSGFGPVDILINNAALCPVASIVEMETSLWDQVVAVNLRGTFLTCKACLPDMLSRQRGVIVNMVSLEAMPGISAYLATKQGIQAFSQSLALEVGDQGVKVIPFGPGMVDTPAIRGVAPDLAPRLGMSANQFLQMSLHPAYPGLMPAEDSGAATAYLVAALADEYQGENVTAYTVLERAGLISASGEDLAEDETVSMREESQNIDYANTISLAKQFGEMIDQTEAEFNQFPVFIRPMARNGFKNKSGQSIQDWRRTAESLIKRIEAIQAGDTSSHTAFLAGYPKLQEDLDNLVTYYQGVPGETARFTKDQAMLRQVEQVSQQRVQLTHSLELALDAWLADVEKE
jgi:NAD(P)-dependent dehydrogenase (short-subunit alcohol dehydrogenase family)